MSMSSDHDIQRYSTLQCTSPVLMRCYSAESPANLPSMALLIGFSRCTPTSLQCCKPSVWLGLQGKALYQRTEIYYPKKHAAQKAQAEDDTTVPPSLRHPDTAENKTTRLYTTTSTCSISHHPTSTHGAAV